ncbi:MAG TPA: PQQ-binding-like beta-propeller repeat protein [Pirellulaceae bacterium]|nr:PQQ-binding-like beta-propeller repeat protein [Pirellulaceae bacterium]
MRFFALLASFSLVLTTSAALAGDWVGFRGLSAGGASDDKGLPTTWSATENVVWKTELPGPGASSPIVTGDKVLVTCYRISDDRLERTLVCADRNSGKILWSKTVPGASNEDPPRGQIMSHGYASSTPVTDGEYVYVQFGKAGVLAFDMQGNQLWQADIGSGSAQMGWGSAASPVIYKNLVIVNAGAESDSVIALDRSTGKEVWKAPSDGLNGCWATPILVDIGNGNYDLVLNAPYEIWGFNPDTGKVRWWCEGIIGITVCPTIVAKDGIVYAIGGGGGPSRPAAIAVKAGGKEDVNQSHVVWRNERVGSYVTSPVIVGDHLYWINNQNQAMCLKLADGEVVYQERLSGGTGGGRPQGGGFGGGRGGGGSQPYASVVAADGKIFAFMRQSEALVLAAEPTFKILARNKLDDDAGIFNATPAIHNGQLLVRSDKYLYCLGTK